MTEALKEETKLALIATVRLNVTAHFECFAFIKNKNGELVRPKCNTLQKRLFAAYEYLLKRGEPIKIIVVKPRQIGCSEGTSELVYHHSRRFNLSGIMMADKDANTDKIWNLFKAKAEMDGYSDYWGNTFKADTEKASISFRDAGNRPAKAMWDRVTAGSTTAGAAGTRQVAWFSESARYAKDGAFKDSTVIGNVLNSIPSELPNTLIIAESTAEGSGGWHFQTYNGGVTLEKRMAGKMGNGWIQIFVAWHECPDYQLVNTPTNREYFDDTDDRWQAFAEDEGAGIERYGWTPEQIAWRRRKIVSDLGGDVILFKRDYPANELEAWQSSGRKKFHQVAVARMLTTAQRLWEQTIQNVPTAPKLGSLVDGPGGVVFLPTREDHWLWVKEQPMFGCRYLLSLDPMTGEQAVGCDEPDNHAPLLIRSDYVDASGVLHLAEVVAAICVPGGCRWDMDVLADRTVLLAKWYGRCIIVPEVNKAMDYIPLARARNALLYHREAKPDAENPSVKQKAVGFYSSESTRRMWVSAAAEGIREGTLLCYFLPAVKEFDSFIENPRGRAEAAAGTHDDWVASYGIGKLCLNAATTMSAPRITPTSGQWNPYQRQQTTFRAGSAAIG